MIAESAHRENRRRPGGNRGLHFLRVQRVVVRFNVHEDRPDLVPVKRMGGGDKREGGCDHLAAYPQPLQADLQGQRAVVEQADVFRE